MSTFYDALSDEHIKMISRQPVFFVATAAQEGRINLSPKGYDSFRVPVMELAGERRTLRDYNARAVPDVWLKKQSKRNRSIDWLAIRPPEKFVGEGSASERSDSEKMAHEEAEAKPRS